ncbi:MAG TPA: protein-disulfide reductase DsbD family protein [Phycisphaerae bacterium]|nr:protein-disulfide reductase DsbD family protein [Phycisphaerae bacterium]HRY68674.1 protein-disulfide reductase DsbD family protein [Phycisphaerae bacterium]HSA25500.1 protein-disulfide reductase DsbD family protein [Phycisphaerae bacterium]
MGPWQRLCTVLASFGAVSLFASATWAASNTPLLLTPGGSTAESEEGTVARVRLLADKTAVAPGQKIGLALAFAIKSDWHIYWRNRGEGGLEPSFTWQLPPGFSVGPVRFPPPTRHIDAVGDHTFIMSDDPILLTTLAVPENLAAGGKVTISVKAKWLVCKELCKQESQDLSVELPAVSAPNEAKPANTDLFSRAQDVLPLPMDQARNLKKLWVAASVDKIKPGSRFQVAVVLEIEDHQHLNSNKPTIEGLIPTEVFNDATEGLIIGRPVFPPATVKKSEIGEMSLYTGRAVVLLPVEADKRIDAEELRISGVATYQACDDKTLSCQRPTAAEWELTLPVARPDEEVTPAHTDLFGAAPTSTSNTLPVEAKAGQGGPAEPDQSWLQRLQASLARLGLLGYLIMAFLGGLILNLMPCVLPVISIKILSFVQQAKESRIRVFTLGLAFSAGILVSFAVLGVLIVGLGQQWGGLFQRPQVTIGLAAVVTAFAMSLFGVFAIYPPRVVNELGDKVQQEGHLSAFGMGLLATLLGTACTAPFLSVAIAFAVQQTPFAGVMIFMVAGLGMALPYAILAAKPAWLKVVPKAGPWMKTFEHVMAFCLLGTVVFLLNPLSTQLGGRGLIQTLAFLLCVAAAAWLYGHVRFGDPRTTRAMSYAACGAVLVGGWLVCFRYWNTIPDLLATQDRLRLGSMAGERGALDWSGDEIPWLPYTRAKALAEVNAGRTVLIDYTAEWCVNCKANEKLVLNTAAVRQAIREGGVLPFRADYTSFNPEIKEDLDRFKRSGVPMYVIIPAHQPDDPILLDEILTQRAVLDALRRAGPSRKEQAPAERSERPPIS